MSDAPADEPLTRLLMVEDDERLAQLTARYLEQYGIVVTRASDGKEAIRIALQGSFDLVLLDLMLPGCDGIEVCRTLRSRLDLPIIIVTARADEADRVLGLEFGADDYVVKPFSSRELLARIRAQVRRARGRAGPKVQPLRAGRIEVDPGGLRASIDGKPLDLTGYEFTLLRALVERAGRVLSRDQLLGMVHREADAVFDRSIDGHISRLRQKLGDDPRRPQMLKTIRGAGYMLATDTER
ncbi:MAG TPA: response regulator transcription factor [Polyangiaceae bacterium]|nr:response regulator transcription factor [Polyangiaceae bacterium]